MCDVAMGTLCVFPRDLLGLSNRKTGFLLRANGDSVITRDGEESKNCFQTAGPFIKTQHSGVLPFFVTIAFVLCVRCLCVRGCS